MRPLYFHDGALYCASFNRLYRTADLGRSFTDVGTVSLSPLFRAMRLSPTVQRVLRASVYRLRVLSNGNIVLTFKGGVYTLKAGDARANLTFSVKRGSRPVSLVCAPGGITAFGEYFGNEERTTVRIHASLDFGLSWREVYAFRPGDIRHVHGISYDRWADCFWICTGDYGEECRLIKASCDFQTIDVVRSGGQANRFYSTLPTAAGLITATDTPLEQNHIYLIDRRNGSAKQLATIENSSFYSCLVEDRVFVSTNAEPSDVNDTGSYHVWMGDVETPDRPWQRVMSCPVDRWTRSASWLSLPKVPKGLFQFPRMFFPEGENRTSTLVCYDLGGAEHNKRMLCYSVDELRRAAGP